MNSRSRIRTGRGGRLLVLAVAAVTPLAMLVLCVRPAGAQSSYADRVLEDNPAFLWRLDDTDAGVPPANIGSEPLDIEIRGEVTLGAEGLVPDEPDNKSALFNGIDSYIHVPDSDALNVTSGPWTNRSWSMWFSADDASTEDRQVIFEEGGSTRGVNLYVQEGRLYTGIWNRGNDDSGVSSPWISGEDDQEGGNLYLSTPIESGTNYHVTLVMEGDEDGKEGFLRGYLNGGLFQEKTGVGRLFNHGDDAAIGAVFQNTFWADENGNGITETNFFAGRIDEVALFHTALTPGRIFAQLGVDFTPGDFNDDGMVNADDFVIMSENFNSTVNFPESLEKGDVNLDNRVDLADFMAFREIFSNPGGGQAQAVPEPTSGLLGLVALAALGVFRRRIW